MFIGQTGLLRTKNYGDGYVRAISANHFRKFIYRFRRLYFVPSPRRSAYYQLAILNRRFQRMLTDEMIGPASSSEIERMKEHFFRVLEKIGYLRNSSRNTLWGSFSALIGRAKPDERDVRMIRGFFNRVEVTLKRGMK